MTFLDKLDDKMREMGINRNKLSLLSGVPYTTIDGFYKKGYDNAKISTLKKIASALDVSLDYLVTEQEEPEKKPVATEGDRLGDDEREIIRMYRSVDPATRSAMLQLLRAAEAGQSARDADEANIRTPLTRT